MINLLKKLILIVRTIENFPTAISDKLGFSRGMITYRLRNGTKFVARSGTEDLAEIAVVASGAEYKLNLIQLKKNPVVLDLGGYIGTFSIPLAKKLKNKCKIFVYEPDEGNYKIMLDNIKLNKVSSIKLSQMAVSSKPGKGHLMTKGIQTDGYHLSEKENENPNCEITTLPLISQKNKIKKVDILKMDVEGAEYQILSDKKSLEFIKENVHYFFMEYHNIDNKRNYEVIRKTIEDNFNILDHHGVTMALEYKRYVE